MTIETALCYGIDRIGKRDTGLLLSHITGIRELVLYGEKEISADDYERFLSYVKRCESDEPLQYVIGQWEFMGLPFKTDKRALIPRPETELLVEKVLDYIKIISHEKKIKNPIQVLDVCTGSGCIALAIACLAEHPTVITAVDISGEALSLAKENAENLKISNERVKFIKSDLLDAVAGEKFDVIVSNPPYILSREMAELSHTVRGYEPQLALDGGVAGLDFYRKIIPQSKKALQCGGALFLEIGPVSVMDLMEDAGFSNIILTRDYAGLERIISGTN